jgi:hypothetical protein
LPPACLALALHLPSPPVVVVVDTHPAFAHRSSLVAHRFCCTLFSPLPSSAPDCPKRHRLRLHARSTRPHHRPPCQPVHQCSIRPSPLIPRRSSLFAPANPLCTALLLLPAHAHPPALLRCVSAPRSSTHARHPCTALRARRQRATLDPSPPTSQCPSRQTTPMR